MGGRIKPFEQQRMTRELGRLRTGYSEARPNSDRRRPVKSSTWIVTSPAEHYVRAAAELWGGTPESWTPQGSGANQQWRVITPTDTIEAILPPGDPLSQANEMWSRGGCVRRCDGDTEQLSGQPCLCQAEFGDEWFEQPVEKRCKTNTRLSVFLPKLPDFGVWRVESNSYYAAGEIGTHVDLVRAITGGKAVPIRLRIEPRSKVSRGETRRYQVIIVELAGGTTTEQLLAGQGVIQEFTREITGGPAALPAGSREPEAPSWEDLIAGATTRDELGVIWTQMRAAGLGNQQESPEPAIRAWFRRRDELAAASAAPTPAQPPPPPAADEQQQPTLPETDDTDVLWTHIFANKPFDTLTDLERDFWAVTGRSPDKATADHMRQYLTNLQQQKGHPQ